MKLLIGADEVGLGCIAGPMIVCAATGTDRMSEMHCRDSKKYSKNLNRLWGDIRQSVEFSLGYGMCIISADSIASMGYKRAQAYGFKQSVAKIRRRLARYPRAIIDGNDDFGVPFSEAVVKADDKYKVVSLASCIAKANQIEGMKRLHELHPEFAFNEHNGYSTAKHIENIVEHGAIPGVHRMNIVRKMFLKRNLTLKTYKGSQ